MYSSSMKWSKETPDSSDDYLQQHYNESINNIQFNGSQHDYEQRKIKF